MLSKDDIRAARERVKESQTAFAARFGVTQPTVWRWENNGPPDRGPAKMFVEQIIRSLDSETAE